MQQRSNLCRALIHEPELLMLDEPFGALDAFTREELWGVMQALWLEKRFTGVLVTHDLREAVYLADTVYVMSRRPGRIVHRPSTIDIPRPRTLATTFEPHFVDIVHELRDRIHQEHARVSDRTRERLRIAMPWLAMAGAPDRLGARLRRLRRARDHAAAADQDLRGLRGQRFDILMAYCWETLWTTVIGFVLAIAGGLLLGLGDRRLALRLFAASIRC